MHIPASAESNNKGRNCLLRPTAQCLEMENFAPVFLAGWFRSFLHLDSALSLRMESFRAFRKVPVSRQGLSDSISSAFSPVYPPRQYEPERLLCDYYFQDSGDSFTEIANVRLSGHKGDTRTWPMLFTTAGWFMISLPAIPLGDDNRQVGTGTLCFQRKETDHTLRA